ncbi:hypothetical protein B0J17DRAFT_773054 [Rhizoctonia solani]|nr:hypothetical protein B0J17DRAFT_773054 [Rhizoctonia solani]
MSHPYDSHTFLAPGDWKDFAGDLIHSPTLPPTLAANCIGETLKFESFPSTVDSPFSMSSLQSLLSPRTPAGDLAQAGLSVAFQGGATFGSDNTGVDLLDGYPLSSQDNTITLEEFTHLARTVPAGSLLELMALDPVPVVHPGTEYTNELNHDPKLVKDEELKEQFLASNQEAPLLATQPFQPFPVWQSPAHLFDSKLMSRHGVAPADVHLNGVAQNGFVDGRWRTSDQDALPNLPAWMSSRTGSVMNKPLDGVVLEPVYTPPLVSSGSASLHAPQAVRQSVSNLLVPDLTTNARSSEYTLYSSSMTETHIPAEVALSESQFLVPSQLHLAAGHLLRAEPALQPTSSDSISQASAPSKPIPPPAVPAHPKRKHDTSSDTSNSLSRSKRAKATVRSDSNESISGSSGSSGSAIANVVATPAQATAQGHPVALTTPAINAAHEHIASFPVPDRLDLPAVPDREWRESLNGTGSLYFTLSPENRYFNVPIPNTAVRRYACVYACPNTGMICRQQDSKQDKEWLKTISGHKTKSFFSRHEAECLRHLAFHRWEEWSFARGHRGSNRTSWDDARIDAQIVKDIEHPDMQPWCPSEIQTRVPQEDMIKWLKASPLPNGYN